MFRFLCRVYRLLASATSFGILSRQLVPVLFPCLRDTGEFHIFHLPANLVSASFALPLYLFPLIPGGRGAGRKSRTSIRGSCIRECQRPRADCFLFFLDAGCPSLHPPAEAPSIDHCPESLFWESGALHLKAFRPCSSQQMALRLMMSQDKIPLAP